MPKEIPVQTLTPMTIIYVPTREMYMTGSYRSKEDALRSVVSLLDPNNPKIKEFEVQVTGEPFQYPLYAVDPEETPS